MSTEQSKSTATTDTPSGIAAQKSGQSTAIARTPEQASQRLRWNWQDALYIFILLFVVVAMVIRFTPHVTSEIPGLWWDPLLNIWTLAWDTTALLHNPLHLWQAPLLYPNNLTLSYSENLLGDIIYFAPVFLITHNPVLAYNVTFYMIFFLCGLNMYIVARSYTQRRFAAFVAALIYAFAPYRLAQIDHIPITGGEWMPLAFLFLDRSFQHGRWRDWILLALFYLLQLLSSVYLGIFLAYTLVAYLLIRYTRVFVQQWRQGGKTYLWRLAKLIVRPIVVIVVTLGLIVLLMAPYLISLHNGYERSVIESASYSAFAVDFLYTAPYNMLHGILSFQGVYIKPDSEHFLFLGWTVMILTAMGVILAFRRRDATMRAYAWTGLIVLLFAFGPYLQWSASNASPLLGGTPVNRPFPPGIPMPWYLAFYVLPGIKGLRVPARLIDVLLLMLALLGASVIAWFQDKLDAVTVQAKARYLNDGNGSAPRRRWWATPQRVFLSGFLLLIALAIAFEARPAYLPTTQVPTGTAIPPVYQWLATHGGSQPIIELPMSNNNGIVDEYEAWYDYYTIYHPHPIVNGWSGFLPPITTTISNAMLDFPSTTSIGLLKQYHILYVVFHPQRYHLAESPSKTIETIAQMQVNPDLHLVKVFGRSVYDSDSVWQVI
jgi:hypothetical protein